MSAVFPGSGTQVPYVFDQALALEHERLHALEQVFDPTTRLHLSELGVRESWRCLEVGAGAGSIARWLADRVGPTGHVLALDIDTRFLAETRDNLQVRTADILDSDLPRRSFDLAHARGVLAYLPGRIQALQRMIRAVRPGGWLLVEDADMGAVPATRPGYADPVEYADLFERIELAYAAVLTASGADPHFGAHLPDAMLAAGLVEVGATVHIPFLWGGPTKHVAGLTIDELGDRMVQAGLLSEADLRQYRSLIARERMWQALVPVVSVWGRVPT